MRNLTGPIPEWPDETVTIGASYNYLQKINTAKALAIKNTDLKLEAEFKKMTIDINAVFKTLEDDFKAHVKAKGVQHNENALNTMMYYVNNYPVATQRQMSEGETYEAYVTPNLLSYVYPTVRREHRTNLAGAGFTDNTHLNLTEIIGLSKKTVVESPTYPDQIMALQTMHYEGRVAHFVSGNGNTSGVLTDPIRMLDVSKLNPIRPFPGNIVHVGHACRSTKVNLNGQYYFYINNPAWIGLTPLIGHWEGNRLVPFNPRFDFIVTGVNEVALPVDLKVDTTGIHLKTEVKNIQERDNGIGIFDGDKWTINFYDVNNKECGGDFKWSDLFNSAVKPITPEGPLNVSYDWLVEDETAYLYLETRIKLLGHTKIIRLHLLAEFDNQRRTLTISWPKKYNKLTHDEKDLVGAGNWVYPDVHVDSPLNPEYSCGAFVRGEGYTASTYKNGKVLVRYFRQAEDSLVKFIDNLPNLPKVTAERHRVGSVANYAMLPDTKRMFLQPNKGVTAVLYNNDGRKEIVHIPKFENVLYPNGGLHYGIDVNLPLGIVNEIKDNVNGRTLTTNVWGAFNGYGSAGIIQFSKDGSFESEDKPLSNKFIDDTDTFIKEKHPNARWVMFGLNAYRAQIAVILVSGKDGTLAIYTGDIDLASNTVSGKSNWVLKSSIKVPPTLTVEEQMEFIDVYASTVNGKTDVIVINGYQYQDSYIQFSLAADNSITGLKLNYLPRIHGVNCNDGIIGINSNGFPMIALTNIHYFNPKAIDKTKNPPIHVPGTDVTVFYKGRTVPIGRTLRFDLSAESYLYFGLRERVMIPITRTSKLPDTHDVVYYGHYKNGVLTLA